MFSNTSAVRQVTQGTEPHGEDRFRLIDELPLVDINGFSFVSSADLTESDALNRLIEEGYSLPHARRLLHDARLFFARYVSAMFLLVGVADLLSMM